MAAVRPVGRAASSRKYDLFTALGAYALARGAGEQRIVLRLITLITARYNWMRDELAVGQREIARLWSVDERTVKREMARLREMGWLRVRRPGARGRVTEYSLETETILAETRPAWSAVGSDFEARLDAGSGAGAFGESKVVPFPGRAEVACPDEGPDEWSHAQRMFFAEDPARFATWVRPLRRLERAGGQLVLRAPSRFHASYVQTHLADRLLALCRAADAEIEHVEITD